MSAQHKHHNIHYLHDKCDSYFCQPNTRMLFPFSDWPLTHLTLIKMIVVVSFFVCQKLVHTHTDAVGMNGSGSSKTGGVERGKKISPSTSSPSLAGC